MPGPHSFVFTVFSSLLGALSVHGQAFHLGMDAVLPMGDFSDLFGSAIGPVSSFEYGFNGHVSTTLDVGYMLLTLNEDGREVLDDAAMVPVLIGWTYHLDKDKQTPYFHLMVGGHSISRHYRSDQPVGADDDGSAWCSSMGLGFGSRAGRFDLALRTVFLFAGAEEDASDTPSWYYMGLHATYRILGK